MIDQTINAGPEPQNREDWRDWLYEAAEFARTASRAEWDTKQAARLRYIRRAMDALLEAEAMLCQK
jgi:hypothetical protein